MNSKSSREDAAAENPESPLVDRRNETSRAQRSRLDRGDIADEAYQSGKSACSWIKKNGKSAWAELKKYKRKRAARDLPHRISAEEISRASRLALACYGHPFGTQPGPLGDLYDEKDNGAVKGIAVSLARRHSKSYRRSRLSLACSRSSGYSVELAGSIIVAWSEVEGYPLWSSKSRQDDLFVSGRCRYCSSYVVYHPARGTPLFHELQNIVVSLPPMRSLPTEYKFLAKQSPLRAADKHRCTASPLTIRARLPVTVDRKRALDRLTRPMPFRLLPPHHPSRPPHIRHSFHHRPVRGLCLESHFLRSSTVPQLA